MRKSIIILALAALGFIASEARAEIVDIKGTVTPVGLGRACSGAGGNFHSGNTGYSCVKENCNGKGGTCAVLCGNNGKCTGHTPPQGPKQDTKSRRPFADLNAILTNKVGQVTGAPGTPPAGGILDSSPGFSRQGPASIGAPAAPSAPPPPIIR